MKNIAKQKERGQVRHADESSKIIFKWNIKKFDSIGIDLKIVKKMQWKTYPNIDTIRERERETETDTKKTLQNNDTNRERDTI